MRPEQQLQQACYQYICYKAPHALCFHVQNNVAFKQGKRLGGIYKSMGVTPGVADLLLFWKSDNDPVWGKWPYHGAIELKSAKGKQTPAQKAFEEKWTALGGLYAIVRSPEELEELLIDWRVL